MGARLRWVLVLGSSVLLGGLMAAPTEAAPTVSTAAADGETCYIVSDSNAQANDSDAEDLLIRVNRFDSNPATNETNIGTGTGTFNIEAIALQPGTGVLYAADAGTLGTLDVETGKFKAIGPIGKGTGPLGEIAFKDVDGLSFDATSGLLYGTDRRRSGEEDLLLVIDPVTGAAIPGKLAGADYAVVTPIAGLHDVDAIAVDPLDGKMYGVVNTDGRGDRLVSIDKATGKPTDIGVMGAEDVEGLGFASGQLIGTTGKVFDNEGLWDIDKATGAASNQRILDNSRDYESFDCLNAPRSCLTIMEDAVPDSPQDFSFKGTGPIVAPDFVLDDDAASDTPNARSNCELPAGSYTATQQPVPEWPLVGLVCEGVMGATTEMGSAHVIVNLAPGDKVTCIFKNSPAAVPAAAPALGPPKPPLVLGKTISRPAAQAPAAPLPGELPHTGAKGARNLVLAGGLALSLGGFGVMGGARRRRSLLG